MGKLFFYFPALLFKALSLFLPCIDLHTDGAQTVIIMLIIHPGRIDLLFEDIDLSFQLLFQQIGLIELIPCRFNGTVDLLDLFLNGLILCFHLLMALV